MCMRTVNVIIIKLIYQFKEMQYSDATSLSDLYTNPQGSYVPQEPPHVKTTRFPPAPKEPIKQKESFDDLNIVEMFKEAFIVFIVFLIFNSSFVERMIVENLSGFLDYSLFIRAAGASLLFFGINKLFRDEM